MSLYFEMDLKEVGLLDAKKWSMTIKKGYGQMNVYLKNLADNGKFGLKKPL